jgi:polyribonucleotide nucleotidyltransferase
MDGLQQAKMEWTKVEIDETLKARVAELSDEQIIKAMTVADKAARNELLTALREEVQEKLAEDFPEAEKQISQLMGSSRRRRDASPDPREGRPLRRSQAGRDPEISCEVGVLPRTHGSALFTRGQTQALGVARWARTGRAAHRVDQFGDGADKSFMLHYNFPPFCTGEAKPLRGTSRREQGHGALAERAIQPLLPAVRRVPLHDPDRVRGAGVERLVLDGVRVRRVAVADGRGRAAARAVRRCGHGADQGRRQIEVLTDILGVEDALGDMDFKVAGSEKGVTSIQMDIKISGLDTGRHADALERARKGRLHILA